MQRRIIRSLLPILLATGMVSAADNRARPMDTTAMLKDKIAALDDAVYLHRDDTAVASLSTDALAAGFEGLLLGAPRRVDGARSSGFAALLLAAHSGTRARQLPWERNAIVTAVDIDRGTVYAGPAFVPDPSKSPEPAPQPAPAPDLRPATAMELQGEGSSADTAWLEVQRLLRVPPQTMRLLLRVFYFDQVSNAVLVERTVAGEPPTTALSTADAMAVVARLRAAGQSAHRLPAFRRGVATPALDAPGIAFTLGRIGSPLPLHAALRIEPSPAMRVLPGLPDAPPSNPPPPAAVLRTAVLVLMRDRNKPFVFPIEVPVWSPKPLVPGQTVDAAFSIDLATLLPPAALQPGAQVYLLAGRHIAGPQALVR